MEFTSLYLTKNYLSHKSNGIFYGNISLKVSQKITEIPGGGSKTKVPPVCGKGVGINIF